MFEDINVTVLAAAAGILFTGFMMMFIQRGIGKYTFQIGAISLVIAGILIVMIYEDIDSSVYALFGTILGYVFGRGSNSKE